LLALSEAEEKQIKDKDRLRKQDTEHED